MLRGASAHRPTPGWHMSVEPTDPMSEIWLTWQGRAINDSVRLGRYLGGSDHSAVFLTEPAAAVVKLVPAIPALAESQLSDWRTAAGLAHPHLIRLLEAGRCEIDEQPHLYALMEYADQNLAQPLKHRPLTVDEMREVLTPTLDALAFLHSRKLVQGQLKPTNILAVGEQLKLASDTVRGVREGGGTRHAVSAYDPPEAREGSYSAAGDVWGLGLSVFEALTGTLPPGLNAVGSSEHRQEVVLPRDFSPTFREIVTLCLSRRPYDRPKVTEIEAWLRRQTAAAVPPVGVQRPVAAPEAIRPELASAPVQPSAPERRSFVLLIVAAVVILAVAWAGIRAFRVQRHPAPPAAQAPRESPSTALAAPAAAAQQASPPRQVAAVALPAAIHEEVPDVPLRARRTIHGHIRVSVRVMVDKDGNVVAALADQRGPSKYFERLAMAAAKKWTFPPADTPARRVELVHFEFTREGTKGHAVSLQ
jgi:outer membrane biosynthesis protein TonB